MLFMAGWRVSGEVKSGDSRGSGIDTVVVAWIIAVFAITALRALPLFFYHLNLSKLSFTSRIPIWVGIGIEVAAGTSFHDRSGDHGLRCPAFSAPVSKSSSRDGSDRLDSASREEWQMRLLRAAPRLFQCTGAEA